MVSDCFSLTVYNLQLLRKVHEGVDFGVEIPIKCPGKLDALAVWFDLHLYQDITVTTSPSGPNCWEQAIFPVLPISSDSKSGIFISSSQ